MATARWARGRSRESGREPISIEGPGGAGVAARGGVGWGRVGPRRVGDTFRFSIKARVPIFQASFDQHNQPKHLKSPSSTTLQNTMAFKVRNQNILNKKMGIDQVFFSFFCSVFQTRLVGIDTSILYYCTISWLESRDSNMTYFEHKQCLKRNIYAPMCYAGCVVGRVCL